MRIRSFLPAIGWFILTLVLFCLPGSVLPGNPVLEALYADKWAHVGIFFILCVLFARPLQNSGKGVHELRKWLLLVLFSGICYGVVVEFAQEYWIPNRSFETWDIAADAAGCLLAWWYHRQHFPGRGKKKLVPMEIGTATKTNCL